tara:strand:- start:313 stop:558 length:246 start_codon:yes stop_codon:yes gene_type:complete
MRYDKNGKLIRGKKFTDAFGTVNLTNKEEKEAHFGEICRTEDARVLEAERKFHARMTQREKDDAVHWIAHYRYIVGEADKD